MRNFLTRQSGLEEKHHVCMILVLCFFKEWDDGIKAKELCPYFWANSTCISANRNFASLAIHNPFKDV